MHNFKLDDKVYYPCDTAPFKVTGIKKNEIEIEGDFSGGTHNVCQKSWVGIDKAKPYDHSKVVYYLNGQRFKNGIQID